MRRIYADTSVWNRLCDENVDPCAFSFALANHLVAPVLGYNVFYEIAKLFFSGFDGDVERGIQLFTYLKGYLALRVPIVKENWAILIEEALHETGRKRMESCFRSDTEYQATIEAIDKLCEGRREEETTKFFENRKSAARGSRTSMKDHLEAQPNLKAILMGINETALSHFLMTESTGPQGQLLLLGHLCAEFPKDSRQYLAGVAVQLLRSPDYRTSRAMTRGDLYLNWRCANRGSIRSDLPDDTFHVISAAYCDIFATTELDQANIARLMIEGIKPVVCDKSEMVSERLIRELEQTAN